MGTITLNHITKVEGHAKLNLKIENNKITEVKYQGKGCAISQASASLITDFIKGKTLNEVKNLKKEGVGIIYISHRLNEIFQITDRVTVFRDGKKIGTVMTEKTDREELITMMVGRELKEFYPKRDVPIGKTIMEVKNLTISGIVEDVSFNLKSGEILGLFGLLGSGRQNIVRALYGIDEKEKGDIIVEGCRGVDFQGLFVRLCGRTVFGILKESETGICFTCFFHCH